MTTRFVIPPLPSSHASRALSPPPLSSYASRAEFTHLFLLSNVLDVHNLTQLDDAAADVHQIR
jgi:hypothetical protein